MADPNTEAARAELDAKAKAQQVAQITHNASLATLQGVRIQLSEMDPADPLYADKGIVVAKAEAVYNDAHQTLQTANEDLATAQAAFADAASKAP